MATARHRMTGGAAAAIAIPEDPPPARDTGRYRLRFASSADDIARARTLRARCFGEASGGDVDSLDLRCRHVLVEAAAGGALVCCFRLQRMTGDTLGSSYSAQFYDLARLSRFAGPMIEVGRFCVDPAWRDPDILRVAWSGLTACVDATGTALLFGCSSYAGVDPLPYLDSFANLRARHLAPEEWRPGVAAPEVLRFAGLPGPGGDAARAMRQTPPLLRSYLAMGGWVSDHAVIDRDLRTLHVFTGVEIAAIPDARKRLLRALAQDFRYPA